MRTTWKLAVTSIIAMLSAISAQATVIAYDGFETTGPGDNINGNYNDNQQIKSAYNSVVAGGSIVNFSSNLVWDGNTSLIEPQLDSLTNNYAAIDVEPGKVTYAGHADPNSREANRELESVPTNTTFYISGLMQIDSVDTNTASLLYGGVMGFTDGNPGANGSAFNGVTLGFNSDGTNMDLVVHGGNTAPLVVQDNITLGEIYFVVAKVEFDATTNDTVSVYVNPTSTTEPGVADLVVSTRNYADALSDFGFASFFTRSTEIIHFDELTMATAWSDIVEPPLGPLGPQTTIVQWGEPDGSTNIVAGAENVDNDPTASYSDAQADAFTTTNYYLQNPGERSPLFQAVSSYPAFASKQVQDNAAYDRFRIVADNSTVLTNAETMLVWDDYLATPDEIGTFEWYGFSAQADSTELYFIIRKSSGDWYAASAASWGGAGTATRSIADARAATWYDFTPMTNGAATVGAETDIDTTDVVAVGAYFVQTDAGTASLAIYTGYFRATSTEPGEGGFAGFLATYPVLSGDPDADYDSDDLSDWGEYVFGGIPTNGNNTGTQPSFDATTGDYGFSLIGDNTISYSILTSVDLTSGSWSTNGPTAVSENDDVLHAYTSNVGTSADELFIKLLVE